MHKNTQNILLIKEEIGHAKRSVYDLPAQTHAFGVGSCGDVETAQSITSTWVTHVPSVPPKDNAIDYLKFNKSAATNFASSKGMASEASNNGKKVVNVTGQTNLSRGGPVRPLPSDIDPGFAFGKPGRPGTPVSAVLSNTMAIEFEKQSEAKQLAVLAERRKKFVPSETKSSRCQAAGAAAKREAMNVSDETSAWRLSKFRNVKATFTLPDRKKEEAEKRRAAAAAAEE